MLENILDLCWPRKCPICGRVSDRPKRHLCSDCLMRLPLIPIRGLCERCGREAMALDKEFLCEECRGRHKPAFDRAGSALRFEGEARELVNGFKFRRQLWLKDDLCDLLEGYARARFKIDEIKLIVPVPSTLKHRFLRGYNQCDCLAQGLAKRLNVKLEKRMLQRVGNPARQGSLSEEDRHRNVVGTFAVTRHGTQALSRLGNKPILLVVDDIMTTGSTLSEISSTLKAAYDCRVWCLTLAKSYLER